jgi:protein disulfide isomerase family A protein 3
VNGYPTLFVFRNGKETKYEGPRQADGIVKYMKKQVGPAAKPLATKEEVEKFVKSEAYAVVGFFTSKSSQLQSSFLLVSTKSRENYLFGKVTDAALAKEYGINDDGVIAFKSYDEGKVVYNGAPKTAELQKWVELHSLPLIGDYTSETAETYQKRSLPIAKLFIPFDLKTNEKQAKYFVNRLKKGAEAYKGKILVAVAKKSSFDNEVKDFNLQDTDAGLIIDDVPNQKKYRCEDKFSADSVLKFFNDFDAKTLRAYVRSEKIPTSNDGPVKTVVGLTFDEIVNDAEKDVLIEFYAPWCGHCKSLAPKYEELGKKLKSVPTVTIAKLDATANDFDRSRFEVSGYPTIYFVPAQANAKPLKYEGDREVDAMYKFVKKNAKKSFKKI